MHDIDGTKYTELPATSKKLIADKDEVNPDEPTDPTDPTDPSDPSEPGSSPSENEIFVPGVAANAKNYITINSAYAGAKIKYKSSDKKIAAVNGKGVIKFKKNGIVTITAIDKKTKTELGSHTFNVIMPEITQKNVEVTQGTVSINGFDYLKNANSKVVWVSSKPSVASVDASSGEIKITGTGKAKIYAVFGASDIKDKNGSKKKYKFTLKVK
ncbi:MAG: Ig-like domain-containing protein [Lachnospiraceae bacterium]|nr:Ig-like domain-containing protein [Lachnospiraceae bacterium]